MLGYVVVFSITAYLVRGLQYVLGTSKRAVTERAEEMGAERDGLPTSYTPELEATQQDTSSDTMDLPEPPGPTLTFGHSGDDHELRAEHQGPVQDLRHELSPSTVSQQWATMCTRHLDISTYTILLFSVGIPVYFSIGYAMPLHLIISVLAYLFALAVPSPRWQRVLHPLLLSAAIIVCLVWVFALCRGQSLQDGLREYSTNTKYLKLWSDQEGFPRPGAGDILSSILDTSIIALALPMFQYRNELKRNFGIIVPNLVVSAASVFGYPSLCYAIGISSKRSLTFAVRSLTLALANPAVTNLGGDRSLVAVICIMSGILGVLIGPRLLKVLRIPEGMFHNSHIEGTKKYRESTNLEVDGSSVQISTLRQDGLVGFLSEDCCTIFISSLLTSSPSDEYELTRPRR